MNVFDLILPAISQSLSGQNWLLGLIFAAVVTVLIGLVIGWLWGRAWNATWTPWASSLPTIVVSALMVVIFGSLLTLHGLTSEHFGFASLRDIPSQTAIERSIKSGENKGVDARKALEDDNLFTPIVEFCWNLADTQESVAKEIPKPQASGSQQGQSTQQLLQNSNQHRAQMEKQKRDAHMKKMFEMLEQYKTAYYMVLILLLSAVALMMLSIAALAYHDINLIPVDEKLRSFCPEQKAKS